MKLIVLNIDKNITYIYTIDRRIKDTEIDDFLTEIKLLRTIKNLSIGTEITCTYTIWKATPEMLAKQAWLRL